MSEGFVSVPKGRIHYDTRGKGHPVVLIHAGIADGRMWDREMKSFSERFHVIRYDVRGFGRSSRASAPYSDSGDLAALLAHLEIDRPMLVGVSNGGRIALDYAVEHPDGVEALVPVCSGLQGYDPAGNLEATTAFEDLERQEKKLNRLYRAGHLDQAIDGIVDLWAPAQSVEGRRTVRRLVADNLDTYFAEGAFSTPVKPDTAGRLRDLTTATLVLSAERDVPAMDFMADFMFERIPGATRAEVAGADHLPNLSRPEDFDRIVFEFLS